MMTPSFFLSFSVALMLILISACLVAFYKKIAIKINLFDIPNQRSSHTIPTPRGGGIVFATLWLMSITILYACGYLETPNFIVLFFPALIVGVIGFIEDIKNLSISIRFLFYLAASSIPPLALIFGSGNPINMIMLIECGACLFFIGWSINLYNFMDGTDGIAGIEGIFILSVGALLFLHAHAFGMALTCLILISTLLGFLIFNWPPAKIFMGDVGSAFLGCVIASMSIIGKVRYGISLMPWLIAYGIFLFDANITLLRRMLNGERWYQPHRSHAYQRLVQSGWSHSRLLMAIIVVNLSLAVLAILTIYFPNYIWLNLSVAMLILLASYLYVEQKKPYITLESE